MAGLPKKYAKMGFKKGWAAYRASKRKKSVPRAAPKKVKHMARNKKAKRSGRRKFSTWGMMKGVLYTGAVAIPIYTAYTQFGGGAKGAEGAIKAACFVSPDNKFDFARGAQIWTPVAALAVVDFATSKLPIQSRIRNGVNRLIG